MTARESLPVRLDLALAFAREGDMMAAARRLAALNDPDLRPLAAVLLDMLGPLLTLGVIDAKGAIDRKAVLGFCAGVLAWPEDAVLTARLETVAAAFEGWRDARHAPRLSAQEVRSLREMLQAEGETSP